MGRKPLATSMGSKRHVETSICLWVDLLGYGAMLRKVEFNPVAPEAQQAIARLFQFQEIVATHSHKIFHTMVINDGCVAYRDLSPRSRAVTYDFVNRSYRLFKAINDNELANGYPGARAVIAAGFRARRNDGTIKHLAHGIGNTLINQIKSGQISAEEAIKKAVSIQPNHDAIASLQANFAFTKAYLIDAAGSGGGFLGNNFYLDANLLPSIVPDWITTTESIHFEEPGLSGEIIKVDALKLLPLNHPCNDLLNAFEVAEKLCLDSDIRTKLKELRRTPTRPSLLKTNG